ncbi:MAG: hypothetical protein NC337_05415 [Roseburia sp.]|nr:hypothetical protein [Roseburia sp.]
MSTEENYLDNLLKAVSEPKPEAPDESVEAQEPVATEEGLDTSDVDLEIPDLPDTETDTADLENISGSDIPAFTESLEIPEEKADTAGAETLEPADILDADLEIPDVPDMEGDLDIPDISDADLEIPDIPDVEGDLDIPDISDADLEIPDIPDVEGDLDIPDIADADLEIPDLPDVEEASDISDPGKDISADIPKEISIDGLDTAIEEATELAIAGELDMKELEVGDGDDLKLEDIEIPDAVAGDEMSDADKGISDELEIDAADLDFPDEGGTDGNTEPDDGLDEVLNMLDADSDSDLAEINSMLKKSDNNEPLQDDMMDLLNQMADNEAAFINAEDGITEAEEGGVPAPEKDNSDGGAVEVQESADEEAPQSGKKKGSKKKKGAENASGEEKKPGVFGKMFNALTEDLVPEPTEEELAAEKAVKEAKKQENLTKKEEEKAAKEEEKKKKAEEKEAAKKAKAEEAEKKKKEKQAAKEAKLAAKKAKEEAAGPKPKRIPPKKLAIGAAFGISVGGAILVASNVLSTQGYLQKAKNAYYEGDYKTAYLSTYGMELSDSDNLLIQKRSETILKLQRRYDSYETNLKLGREVEALNALLEGITTYDYINADAEQYGVLTEIDAIKSNILNVLSTKYGLDEESARTLLETPDSMTYTMALYAIVNGN